MERRESSRRRRALEAGEIDGIFEQCEDEGVDTRVKVLVEGNSMALLTKCSVFLILLFSPNDY